MEDILRERLGHPIAESIALHTVHTRYLCVCMYVCMYFHIPVFSFYLHKSYSPLIKVYINAYRTYIHTYIHKYLLTYILTYLHTYTCDRRRVVSVFQDVAGGCGEGSDLGGGPRSALREKAKSGQRYPPMYVCVCMYVCMNYIY